ncbi:protein YAE1 homolog [Gastrophryne carolinensis]
MAWVRAAAELRHDEDVEVFDEEDDEMNLLQKDWRRSMEKRLKEGYREGVDAGKKNSLQSGFNLGYKLGVNMVMPCGEFRGAISALITWCQMSSSDPSTLGELLTAVGQYEDQMVKALSSMHQAGHPSELSDCMEDMGLGAYTHEKSQGSCDAGQDCCRNQEPLPPSLLNSRTTQQLNSAMKLELCRIFKDTYAVAQQLHVPEDLLSYLQTLKMKYSLV